MTNVSVAIDPLQFLSMEYAHFVPEIQYLLRQSMPAIVKKLDIIGSLLRINARLNQIIIHSTITWVSITKNQLTASLVVLLTVIHPWIQMAVHVTFINGAL